MILERLVLFNFGPFGGRQTIEFSERSGEGPITLVGGMNGFGKTTILDGLQLALYGKLAKCSNRNGLAYAEFLTRCIHRGQNPTEGASLEVVFRNSQDGEERVIKARRWWGRLENGVSESFEVWVNDESDEALTADWAEFIEEILPQRLAPLFFFDAEKIESLADPETSSRAVASAVHSLLGLDVVDQLGIDLVELERKKRLAGSISSEEASLVEGETRLKESENDRTAARQKVAELRTKIERAQRELQKIEEDFRQHGGQLWLELENLESDKESLSGELTRLENDLMRDAEGPLPLLLVAPLLESAQRQDVREHMAREAQSLAAVLRERDRALLEKLTESEISEEAERKIRSFLEEDSALREQQSGGPVYLELDDEAHVHLHALMNGGLTDTAQRVLETLHDHRKVERRVALLERRLAGLPDEDQIRALHEDREACLAKVESLNTDLSDAEEGLRLAGSRLEMVQREYSSALQRFANQKIEKNERERTRVHSARVRQTLVAFREKVLALQLGRVEDAVLDSLRTLYNKTRLLGEIRIDPGTFEVTLMNDEGQRIPANRLSAGERQLLAIAILWGLAKASAHQIPVIVDTPLGRLDSVHRLRLTDKYFPNASHQVVLLSTDEEVDEQLFKRLEPSIGWAYLLEHDDHVSSTRVTPGYFWGGDIAAAG